MSWVESPIKRRRRNANELWLCIVLASGCTGGTIEAPKPPAPRPIQDYRWSSTKAGISIAVEPLLDEAMSKRLFVMDLPAMAIVPVYVVVQNAGAHSIQVQKSGITLDMDGSVAAHSRADVPPAGTASRAARSAAATVIGIGALASGLGAIVLAPAAAAMSAPEVHRRQANERLMYCELPDRSLAPGETMFGYVYLRVDRAALGNAKIHLRFVSASPQREAEEFSFDIGGVER